MANGLTFAATGSVGDDAADEMDSGSFAHSAHVAAFPIGIAPERFLEEMKKGETQETGAAAGPE